MRTIAKNFFQGLLVFVPLVGTIWVVYKVLTLLDEWTRAPFPGFGLILTLVLITLLGLLANNVVGRRVIGWIEAAMKKLPVVSLLYSSLKDLLGAFVGDQRSFNKPVMVEMGEGGMRLFGFVTCERFDDPRLRGFVSVYLPQAYNFAGNIIVVDKSTVHRVDADPAQFMAFIVSGGVAEMSAARTIADGTLALTKTKKKGKKS